METIDVKIKNENIMDLVYKSAIKFLTPLNLEETYKVFINEALKISKAQHGSIILIKNGHFTRAYSTSTLLNQIKPRTRGYTYNAYKTKTIKILTKTQLAKIHPEILEQQIEYDIIIPLVNDNRSIGVFTILSKHKLSKDQIRALKLFSPLGTLAIRKAQLYLDVQKTIEARDLFVSIASHELRTPLTTSYIYLQLIERNYAKNKPFDIKWVTTLKDETERLSSIINELLEINQINMGKFSYNLEVCNIDDVINRVISNFKIKYKNRFTAINKIPSENKLIICDSNKLISVFINLLDNAIKHSDETSKVTVLLESDRKKYITISIQDKGEGIPREDLKKIFDDFYKAKNNTKPGMGLGLFIAKRIIDKHRGKILVTSQLNKGTNVSVQLPFIKDA